MFLSQQQKKEQEMIRQEPIYDRPKSKNIKIAVLSAVFIAMIIFGIFLVFKIKNNGSTVKSVSDGKKPVATSTDKQGNLPGELNNENGEDYLYGTSTENLKAEDISFGLFYKKTEDDFKAAVKEYDLPVNIKVDTINYYDLSRKIDLDKYVDDLDKNGFAIFENNISPSSRDFFSMYRYLLSKQIPIMITDDFLLYYYQNTFKKVYMEVEKNVFYDNVWDMNNKLFTIALTRYKKRLSETGAVNDQVLEAERLELAFFAVALKLLSPTSDQVNIKNNLNDAAKFNVQEAEKYDFTVPDYLKDDVERELELIRSAKSVTKSPVFLYDRDYSVYSVPENYKDNVKLNNFYLVLKWLNSSFPVYFISKDCPDCLLDHEDWIINMAAANFIAKDLADNQDLKNRWAIIYKFISFFSGLRQDLTYLHYNQAMKEIFGKDYVIEDIFSSQNENRENDLSKIQAGLGGYSFSELEGMLDRTKPENKPLIGMRILQQAYWPNDYIFSQLSGYALKSFDQTASPEKLATACRMVKNDDTIYRCAGFGLDIINLIYPVKSQDQYFISNTNYENYPQQIDLLRSQIKKFDNYSWNNNIYWLNLDLARTILEENGAQAPVFMRSQNWPYKKDLNAILGSWVNLHLPEENLINYQEQANSGLGASFDCGSYNYVEPNLKLIQEMISRNEMLIKMLTMLHVAEKTNAVSIELKELNQKLERMLEISRKELTDTELDGDDCIFLKDFASHYKIDNEPVKSFTLDFKGKNLTESIAGLKLLAIVNQFGDKKAIVIGPIFNYLESH